MVNKGFIIAFPITFIIFIGYMVIQVLCAFEFLASSLAKIMKILNQIFKSTFTHNFPLVTQFRFSPLLLA